MIDFGLAKNFDPENKDKPFMKNITGSPYYIAPEVLECQYTERCDVWSCGVLLFVMLTGEYPFNGSSTEELFAKIKKGVYDKKLIYDL